MAVSPTSQYIRKVGLQVQTSIPGPVAGTEVLDLSNMRIRFQVIAPDVDVPPSAVIRIYNLKEETAKQIQGEFQAVQLKAGYQQGAYGTIFNGTITRVRKGRENNLDSFVEISASDLQMLYSYGFVNTPLAAGANSLVDQQNALKKAMDAQNAKYQSTIPNVPKDAATADPGYQDFSKAGFIQGLARQKVLFGLFRERMSDVANNANASWAIQDSDINIIPLTGFQPGIAIQINAATGLVGVPEATVGGIDLTTLLNPNIKNGRQIQINNKDITTTLGPQGQPFAASFPNAFGPVQFFAPLSNDGFYRAIVVEHEGDTWGNEWYTHITALAVDPSAIPDASIFANGFPYYGVKSGG